MGAFRFQGPTGGLDCSVALSPMCQNAEASEAEGLGWLGIAFIK